MNERIQALKKQAFVKGHWSENGERFIGDHIDMDKFVELIVRECLETIEEMDPHSAMRDIDDIYIVVEKHFGVEE